MHSIVHLINLPLLSHTADAVFLRCHFFPLHFVFSLFFACRPIFIPRICVCVCALHGIKYHLAHFHSSFACHIISFSPISHLWFIACQCWHRDEEKVVKMPSNTENAWRTSETSDEQRAEKRLISNSMVAIYFVLISFLFIKFFLLLYACSWMSLLASRSLVVIILANNNLKMKAFHVYSNGLNVMWVVKNEILHQIRCYFRAWLNFQLKLSIPSFHLSRI